MKEYFEKQIEKTQEMTQETIDTMTGKSDYFKKPYNTGDKLLFCMLWEQNINRISLVKILESSIDKHLIEDKYEFVDISSNNIPRFIVK